MSRKKNIVFMSVVATFLFGALLYLNIPGGRMSSRPGQLSNEDLALPDPPQDLFVPLGLNEDSGINRRAVVEPPAEELIDILITLVDQESGSAIAGTISVFDVDPSCEKFSTRKVAIDSSGTHLSLPREAMGAGSAIAACARSVGYDSKLASLCFSNDAGGGEPFALEICLLKIPICQVHVQDVLGNPIPEVAVTVDFRNSIFPSAKRSGLVSNVFDSDDEGRVAIPIRPPFYCSVGIRCGKFRGGVAIDASANHTALIVKRVDDTFQFTSHGNEVYPHPVSIQGLNKKAIPEYLRRERGTGLYRGSFELGSTISIQDSGYKFLASLPKGWRGVTPTTIVADQGFAGVHHVNLPVEPSQPHFTAVNASNGELISSNGSVTLYSDSQKQLVKDQVSFACIDGKFSTPARISSFGIARGAFGEISMEGFEPYVFGYDLSSLTGTTEVELAFDPVDQVSFLPVDINGLPLPGSYEISYSGEARRLERSFIIDSPPFTAPKLSSKIGISRISAARGTAERIRGTVQEIDLTGVGLSSTPYIVRFDCELSDFEITDVPDGIQRVGLSSASGEISFANVDGNRAAFFTNVTPGTYALTAAEYASAFFPIWKSLGTTAADVQVDPASGRKHAWTEYNGQTSGILGSIVADDASGYSVKLRAIYCRSGQLNPSALQGGRLLQVTDLGDYRVPAFAPRPLAIAALITRAGTRGRPCVAECFAPGFSGQLDMIAIERLGRAEGDLVLDASTTGSLSVYIKHLEMPSGGTLLAPIGNKISFDFNKSGPYSLPNVPRQTSSLAVRDRSGDLVINSTVYVK